MFYKIIKFDNAVVSSFTEKAKSRLDLVTLVLQFYGIMDLENLECDLTFHPWEVPKFAWKMQLKMCKSYLVGVCFSIRKELYKITKVI